jgi:pantoate--beta-alanine ligase
VVRRLARDLDLGVEIRVCPTVREADGLALSSRNAYLSGPERQAALCLSRALGLAVEAYGRGERDSARLRAILKNAIEAEPQARLEYAEVVDPALFSAPGSLAVLAVRIGKTRLIDNHDLKLPYPG